MTEFRRGLVLALLVFGFIAMILSVPTIVRFARWKKFTYDSKKEFSLEMENFFVECDELIDEVNKGGIDETSLGNIEQKILTLENRLKEIEQLEVFYTLEGKEVIIKSGELVSDFWLISDEIRAGGDVSEIITLLNQEISELNQAVESFNNIMLDSLLNFSSGI